MAKMLAFALATVLASCANAVQLPSTPFPASITDYYIHLDANGKPTNGSNSLPLSTYPYNVTGNQPEQIGMGYISDTEIVLHYVTGPAFGPAVGTVPLGISPYVKSIVRVAPTGVGGPTGPKGVTYTGSSAQYSQVYYLSTNYTTTGGVGFGSFPTALNYTSGLIHYVYINNLLPGTTYHYLIGDPADPTSIGNEVQFKTMPALGAAEPMVFGVWGDLGQTPNSSTVRDQLIASDPDFLLNTGDFTYADDHPPTMPGLSDLSTTYPSRPTPSSFGGPAASNQPRWDFWGRFMQPLIGVKPMTYVAGNHEIESDGNMNTFQSWIARYASTSPYRQSGSSDPRFFSMDVGLTHIVSLCNYAEFGPGTPQYNFFIQDMANINRVMTPWIIIMFHAPVYNTVSTHYKENECMRQIYEPLFLQYGVDLVLHGHVHSYERTNPVSQYQADPSGCAPTWITIGDGGNIEDLYSTWVDTPNTATGNTYCPGTGPMNLVDPGTSATYQVPPYANPSPFETKYQGYCNATSANPGFGTPSGDPYCYSSQPDWSAYREDSFGHATLTIDASGNNATWVWHRADDDSATDTVEFVRDIAACPNRAYGAVPAVARAPLAPPPPPPKKTPTKAPTKPPTKTPTKPTSSETCKSTLVKTCAKCVNPPTGKICCYYHHVEKCTKGKK